MLKRILLFILLLIVGIVGYYWYMFSHTGSHDSGPKQAPIALKKHSEAFNKSVANVVNAYLDMKNAFIEGDTISVGTTCKKFIQLLDSIPLKELKNDTATIYETVQSNLNDIKSNAESLLKQPNITEMRHDFSVVSEVMYPSFFKSINYEGDKLYWQNSPDAFGEGKAASWISNSTEILNPYFGKQDPQRNATMLHSGSILDTIKAQ